MIIAIVPRKVPSLQRKKMQCWKCKLDFRDTFSNIFLLLMGPCWCCEQPKLQQWGMTNRSSHWVSLWTNSAHRTPVGASAPPLPRIVNVNRGTSGSITRALDGTLHSTDPSSTDMAGLWEHSLELSTHICYLEKLPLFTAPSSCPRCCFWAGESLGNVSLAPEKSLSFWLENLGQVIRSCIVALWAKESSGGKENTKITICFCGNTERRLTSAS